MVVGKQLLNFCSEMFRQKFISSLYVLIICEKVRWQNQKKKKRGGGNRYPSNCEKHV
jgi:hypothetical protein